MQKLKTEVHITIAKAKFAHFRKSVLHNDEDLDLVGLHGGSCGHQVREEGQQQVHTYHPNLLHWFGGW
jgi:ribosome-interacting GTPase 1